MLWYRRMVSLVPHGVEKECMVWVKGEVKWCGGIEGGDDLGDHSLGAGGRGGVVVHV